MGMCRFDGSSAAPETHLFTPSVSSYALCFLFFEKFCIFRSIFHWFWQNISSKHTHFGKNLFPRPYFLKKKIHSVDPTFENLCGTYLLPSLPPPPPPPMCTEQEGNLRFKGESAVVAILASPMEVSSFCIFSLLSRPSNFVKHVLPFSCGLNAHI